MRTYKGAATSLALAAGALCFGMLAGAAPAPLPAPLHWDRRDAATLVEIIEDADEEGLNPVDYDGAAIERAARSGDVATLDRVATAAALELAGDYWAGRVPASERRHWHIPGPTRSEAVLLARLSAGMRSGRLEATFDELLPVQDEYRQLRKALSRADDEGQRGQLRANLERWRWMPRDLGARYVMVNVPAFSLKLVKDGETIEERPVIVGKASTPTPQFATQITGVILNPWWEVPKSIVAESVGGLLRRNPAKAAAQGYVVQRNADGSTRVRQKPGPQNALGQMKLFMPNPFSVYLHDTPARGKFDEAERAFSHGCIRVKGAVDFAALLLADDPAWSRAQIEQVLAGAATTKVELQRGIPVFVAYFTVGTRNGEVVSFGDPYRRDPAVLHVLDRQAPAVLAARAETQCPA